MMESEGHPHIVRLHILLAMAPYRRQTFPLLKPYFDKMGQPKNSSDEVPRFVKIVETLEEADVAVLPMSWNYYVRHKQIDDVETVLLDAAKAGKKVLSFQTGDYGVKISDYPNLVVFRANGHRSRLPAYHLGLPPFISDPMQKYFPHLAWEPSAYAERPKIGFCGMANTSFGYAMEELKRITLRNLNYYLGRTKNLPQAFIPTTFRRAQLLEKMRNSDVLDTDFIYRKQYQAGAQTADEKREAANVFYQNIWENQYVLCFRGAGNFSVRLYETLALGRIPIFVNTDCILPLEESIEWKNHVVWIAYEERYQIVEKVLAFHRSHDKDSFAELQKSNRELWMKVFTIKGFFSELFIDN